MSEDTKIRTPRREFCASTSRGLLLMALGGALGPFLESCGAAATAGPGGGTSLQSLPVVPATESNGGLTVAIDASSPLATVGAVALAESPNFAVLIVRTGDTAFTALSAICTHQACTITAYSGGTFVCPCHGSQFSTTGQVLSGPAPLALQRYSAQLANGVLTITG